MTEHAPPPVPLDEVPCSACGGTGGFWLPGDGTAAMEWLACGFNPGDDERRHGGCGGSGRASAAVELREEPPDPEEQT